jgi:hypothetical protein
MGNGYFCTIVQGLKERVSETREKNLFNQFVRKLSSASVGQKDFLIGHKDFSLKGSRVRGFKGSRVNAANYDDTVPKKFLDYLNPGPGSFHLNPKPLGPLNPFRIFTDI